MKKYECRRYDNRHDEFADRRTLKLVQQVKKLKLENLDEIDLTNLFEDEEIEIR